MPEAPMIALKRLHPQRDRDIPLPRYMTPHAAGMDICAAIDDTLVLEPGRIALIPTGWAMALPPGFEAQVRPRSGLAITKGLSLLNTPGTIDSDYRGEIKIIMINLSNETALVHHGERIAQMIINKYEKATFSEVDELSETGRGEGGFGHTGVK